MKDDEWKIAKANKACCICATSFGAGQPYFSALSEATPADLVRQDYCVNCFQDKRSANVFYFWKTAQPETDAEQPLLRPMIDLEYVFDFFKRLEGDPAPQRIAFRYILALMLIRKKLLVLDGQMRNAAGVQVQILREKNGGQSHQVCELELSEDEIAQSSAELGVLLGLAPSPALQSQGTAPATGAEASAPDSTPHSVQSQV